MIEIIDIMEGHIEIVTTSDSEHYVFEHMQKFVNTVRNTTHGPVELSNVSHFVS